MVGRCLMEFLAVGVPVGLVSAMVLCRPVCSSVVACGVARVFLVVPASVLLNGGIVAPVLVVLSCPFHMSHQVVRGVTLLLVWHPLS